MLCDRVIRDYYMKTNFSFNSKASLYGRIPIKVIFTATF